MPSNSNRILKGKMASSLSNRPLTTSLSQGGKLRTGRSRRTRPLQNTGTRNRYLTKTRTKSQQARPYQRPRSRRWPPRRRAWVSWVYQKFLAAFNSRKNNRLRTELFLINLTAKRIKKDQPEKPVGRWIKQKGQRRTLICKKHDKMISKSSKRINRFQKFWNANHLQRSK